MRTRIIAGLLMLAVVAATCVGYVGCANKARTGAVIGAAGGAVAGGVIGKAAGSTTKGVIIGAVVGGAAGAIIGHEMDKQAQELKQNIPGAKVERVGEGIQVTFESGLLFDFDSDVVKTTARHNLDALASSLDKYGKSELLIVGHTDAVGRDAYNQDLSERRAEAVKRELVKLFNLPDNTLIAVGYGKSKLKNKADPLAAENRRVQIVNTEVK